MKKILVIAGCLLLATGPFSQTITQKLQKVYQVFENDPQLKHAVSSLYVIDAKTGKVIFDKNSQIGLAGASTQKIFTATTAFELLGKDYRYKTELGYEGSILKDSLEGYIFLRGTGDPTFGSWRYEHTKPDSIFPVFESKIRKAGIRKIKNTFCVDETKFDPNTIPDGWIWQDIGNYYGAGTWGLNWRENQYELKLKSGNKTGEAVEIVSKNDREAFDSDHDNYLKTALKGTGDNAYIYLPIANNRSIINGTIPVNEEKFSISGAIYDAPDYFTDEFRKVLEKDTILNKPDVLQFSLVTKIMEPGKVIYTYYSPTLDSIIYWFLKRSINLYGEALIKTFAYKKTGFGSTDSGTAIVKDFWKQKGLDENEINICDGSGLSPQNRVTTHAEVEVLKYAKKQSWFPFFYDALPEFNNMKMKSGTINGVKGFAGYHTSKIGSEYIFSFLVNNYSGSSTILVDKMYKVLDVLK